ncbi:MAG: NAD-dependent epimerase/dehydratase family protein [Candidatus Micrarchaeota archaeon]
MEKKNGGDGFWHDKNIFITGASGFVGGAVLRKLVDAGANTVALVRDFVPKSQLFESGLYSKTVMVHGNLEDYGLIRRTLAEYEIQVIFHVGAQTQVTTALADPIGTFEANIEGSWNVLEAARNSKSIESVVVSSSDKAYGIPDKLPYTEDMALKGAFPYEVSKSCVDLIAHSYFKTYGLPVTITRCGNTYGEGDLNFRRLIPKVIKYVECGMPLAMRSDGSPKRDFVYLGDIVDAYLLLGSSAHGNGIAGEAFNFSSGRAFVVRDVVKLMLKLMGSDMLPNWAQLAEKEIPEQYLSIEKAKRVLGWEPKTDLETGLKRTISWYRDFLKNSPSSKWIS